MFKKTTKTKLGILLKVDDNDDYYFSGIVKNRCWHWKTG